MGDRGLKKKVPFEVKEVNLDTGEFEGYAAVFNNVDDGNDLIEPGAFTKTLRENSHRVKICWQHNPKEPIGRPLDLREEPQGLYVKGKISLTTQGRDALILMKDKVVTELSIGYDTVKYQYQGTVRRLKELKLWEISPVTWGMNNMAVITGVKGKDQLVLKAQDFNQALNAAKVEEDMYRARWDIQDAFNNSMRSITTDEEMTLDQKITLMGTTLDQYKAAILAWAAKFMALMEQAQAEGKSFVVDFESKSLESKEGRVLSKRNRDIVEQCLNTLKVLLDATEPAPTTQEGEGGATGEKAKGAGGEDHSEALQSVLNEIRSQKSMLGGSK